MRIHEFIEKNQNAFNLAIAIFSLAVLGSMAYDMYRSSMVNQKEYVYYTAFPEYSDHELASTPALKLPFGARYYWVVDPGNKEIVDIEKHDFKWAQAMRSEGRLDE